jgi:hypothetical protein
VGFEVELEELEEEIAVINGKRWFESAAMEGADAVVRVSGSGRRSLYYGGAFCREDRAGGCACGRA